MFQSQCSLVHHKIIQNFKYLNFQQLTLIIYSDIAMYPNSDSVIKMIEFSAYSFHFYLCLKYSRIKVNSRSLNLWGFTLCVIMFIKLQSGKVKLLLELIRWSEHAKVVWYTYPNKKKFHPMSWSIRLPFLCPSLLKDWKGRIYPFFLTSVASGYIMLIYLYDIMQCIMD